MLPGKRIQRIASSALGEDGGVERDVPFQYQCVRLDLGRSRRAEMQSPGHICGAISVLGPGVAKVDGFWVDDGATAGFRLVMDDSGTGEIDVSIAIAKAALSDSLWPGR